MESRRLCVVIIGPGLIGSALMQQIDDRRAYLQSMFKYDICVVGVVNSKMMLLSSDHISLSLWSTGRFAEKCADVTALIDHLKSMKVDSFCNACIVDCTSSIEISSQYAPWMKMGINVVTPNKKALSGPLEIYKLIKSLHISRVASCMYETTVGAGLPVIGTIADLVRTGDRIIKIEGILSGTLSFIFNTFGSCDKLFSSIVHEAQTNGFTEPDLRDDLNGMDVARKVTILGRECGLSINLEDITVESLVPDYLTKCDSKEFMSRLSELDESMTNLKKEAEKVDACLRYVGFVDGQSGKCSVSIRQYPKLHAFSRLSGADNIIAITSNLYLNQPLIIQGPGAGAQVTANGVFVDITKVAELN